MASKRVELTFSGEKVTEPVIYQIGHKFPVVTDVRRAQVEDGVGWAVLEIVGEPEQIEAALEWVRSLGVGVRPVEGDMLAGD